MQYNYTEREFIDVTPWYVLRNCRYTDLVLYAADGEQYQFDTVDLATTWLFREGIARTKMAAQTGLSALLNGRRVHYRGFVVSCVDKYQYTNK